MFVSILVFILILAILVLAHEFGHFITAKKMGIAVQEFGFGFPPRLWFFKKGDTIYSINLIPLGGFVKLKGETLSKETEVEAREPDSFIQQKIWRRAIVLVAGVAMNVLLAAVFLSIGFIFGLPTALENLGPGAIIRDQAVHVVQVQSGSPADKAGLQAGDVILGIGGESYQDLDHFLSAKEQYKNQTFRLTYRNSSGTKDVDITLAEDGLLGVSLVEAGLVSYPWYRAIWQGIEATFFLMIQILDSLWIILKNAITEAKFTGDIAGPVGIAVLTNQVTKLGFSYVIQFIALLSLNLAIFNLLPWPALDGGRVLFLLIEKLRGKPVDQKVEAMIHSAGFVILILLVILITFKDVFQIGNFLGG